MKLSKYRRTGFDRGRSKFIEGLWIIFQALFVSSFLPGSYHRKVILQLFGAKIGDGVVLKPRIRIKFPWKLTIGGDSWIGEGVWIDNLARVDIADNVCISQGAYLCTGSHNWKNEDFSLIVKPIFIKSSAWICSNSMIAPGVIIGKNSVLTSFSFATSNLDSDSIYQGNPASFKRKR